MTVAQVASGVYSVTVTGPGFAQAVVPSVTVEVKKTVPINVSLTLGNITEVVEVTSTTGAELQTLDSTVGNTLPGDEILALPTFERNSTSLLLLQPLAIPQQFSSQSSRFGGQVAGARSDQNSFLLDGDLDKSSIGLGTGTPILSSSEIGRASCRERV